MPSPSQPPKKIWISGPSFLQNFLSSRKWKFFIIFGKSGIRKFFLFLISPKYVLFQFWTKFTPHTLARYLKIFLKFQRPRKNPPTFCIRDYVFTFQNLRVCVLRTAQQIIFCRMMTVKNLKIPHPIRSPLHCAILRRSFFIFQGSRSYVYIYGLCNAFQVAAWTNRS